MMATALVVSSILGAADLMNTMPVCVADEWSVRVGPGQVAVGQDKIKIEEAVVIPIPRASAVLVKAETHACLPPFDPEARGWLRGQRLLALQTQECTATGLLAPESVRVRDAAGNLLARGADYELDPFWATAGRLENGALDADAAVSIDYIYAPTRLDSIVAGPQGQIRLVPGEAGVGAILPPKTASGETVLANVWIPGPIEGLSPEHLYPVEHREHIAPRPEAGQAERLLPKTLAKLRAGQEVTIVAWGDSVTAGGGVDDDPSQWYQHQFLARLRSRFPSAGITLHTAAWPGRGSRDYLEAPRGSRYDFQRDVLDRKPDLVTIEFVNDAYLSAADVEPHYSRILDLLRGAGAEAVLITPHLVRPDWMGMRDAKFDEDPRPYVRGLRAFAARHNVALADASRDWCRLWRQGIPYITLEANSINHPDARGHKIFADALMALFPEK